MSDKMRWRYGDTNPVVAAVDSATVIEIGDLVYQDVDDARPASRLISEMPQSHPDRYQDLQETIQPSVGEGMATTTATQEIPQELFADNFLGVAMQRSRSGDTESIRVATTGVFEFDCPAGLYELGDLMGVDQIVDGPALANQTVTPVDGAKLAISRVAKRVPAPYSATSVLVDIRSTVMTGGIR